MKAPCRHQIPPLMVAPLATSPAITMTSLELVEYLNEERRNYSYGYTEVVHSDLLKRVPKVLGEHAGNFSCMFNVTVGNGATRKSPGYTFPKREACLMAMSYSYALQAKVFDRMTALEEKLVEAPVQSGANLADEGPR